ncbi:hypothetical protein B0J13DRAFT_618978 [Dactylonectria estremocensis]|uniref:Uncharacterized protein n=1 Tax=Dactylonectria estremocensis TaxID=1079267 RepID=A0A9P9F690_9HYPO|nr:hypothetical protein B0J13DRAFT_618978 [Dactylonectria estremocensis]
MAPVRRYLRISKYSVLECRIYLDNPALAQSWLLNSRKPILSQVIESIRPLVLPKLREEKERRLKKKSAKKKTIKDVVVTDDFEVSIFLMETATRHSLLSRTKHFREKLPPKIESNSTRLISETDRTAVDVDAGDYGPALRQEDDDDNIDLADIPAVDSVRRSKRQRRGRGRDDEDTDIDADASDEDETASAVEISDTEAPPQKRRRARTHLSDDSPDENDDKKKLAMDVSYEGFAIYGSVLCLVVKKRDSGKATESGHRASGAAAGGSGSRPEGQAMMENWISSTQMPVGGDEVS